MANPNESAPDVRTGTGKTLAIVLGALAVAAVAVVGMQWAERKSEYEAELKRWSGLVVKTTPGTPGGSDDATPGILALSMAFPGPGDLLGHPAEPHISSAVGFFRCRPLQPLFEELRLVLRRSQSHWDPTPISVGLYHRVIHLGWLLRVRALEYYKKGNHAECASSLASCLRLADHLGEGPTILLSGGQDMAHVTLACLRALPDLRDENGELASVLASMTFRSQTRESLRRELSRLPRLLAADPPKWSAFAPWREDTRQLVCFLEAYRETIDPLGDLPDPAGLPAAMSSSYSELRNLAERAVELDAARRLALSELQTD